MRKKKVTHRAGGGHKPVGLHKGEQITTKDHIIANETKQVTASSPDGIEKDRI